MKSPTMLFRLKQQHLFNCGMCKILSGNSKSKNCTPMVFSCEEGVSLGHTFRGSRFFYIFPLLITMATLVAPSPGSW